MYGSKDIIILGIESSCDDTSAAVSVNDKILANITAGQEVHRKYGGVVPELASRAHQKHIIPVIDAALKEAGVRPDELSAVAYTRGPGLLGSLLVGSSFAKTMAQSLNIPVLPVHHMKAHVLAHFIDDGNPTPSFPFLCLTVSGGHTQILNVRDHDYFEVLGETLDDAAGEAFDKAAKMLGLPYPGGPEIDRLAEGGDPHAHSFPKPQVPEMNFSFSGFKTSVLNYLEKNRRRDPDFIQKNLHDLCASIRHSIVEILMEKLILATETQGLTQIAIAGGVSANKGLRNRLQKEAMVRGWNVYIPPIEYCTDNGAMIAVAGYFAFRAERRGNMSEAAKARWSMK